MKSINKNRLGATLTALALVAGLGPLAARAQDEKVSQDKPRAQERLRPRDAARELFNITPEQEKKLKEFREARSKDRQAFGDRMGTMRRELRELMKDPKTNQAKIGGLIDGMSTLRADRLKTAIRTRGDWQKLFTPEQLEKMKSYRGAFMGRIGPAGRGRLSFARPWIGRPMAFWAMGLRARLRGMRHPGPFWRHRLAWRRW
jgi:Spy/CpxP family protein refolding chaperone